MYSLFNHAACSLRMFGGIVISVCILLLYLHTYTGCPICYLTFEWTKVSYIGKILSVADGDIRWRCQFHNRWRCNRNNRTETNQKKPIGWNYNALSPLTRFLQNMSDVTLKWDTRYIFMVYYLILLNYTFLFKIVGCPFQNQMCSKD